MQRSAPLSSMGPADMVPCLEPSATAPNCRDKSVQKVHASSYKYARDKTPWTRPGDSFGFASDRCPACRFPSRKLKHSCGKEKTASKRHTTPISGAQSRRQRGPRHPRPPSTSRGHRVDSGWPAELTPRSPCSHRHIRHRHIVRRRAARWGCWICSDGIIFGGRYCVNVTPNGFPAGSESDCLGSVSYVRSADRHAKAHN